MSEENQDDDKQFEPTQKKLDDARKKGDLAQSNDVTTAATYVGFFIVATTLGPSLLQALGGLLSGLIANAPALATEIFNGGLQPAMAGIIEPAVLRMLPWFLTPAVFAIASIVLQKSFVVAPTKIVPKFSRISLLSNVKNKFGRQGLFEFAKSFAKLVVYSSILGFFLTSKVPTILMAVQLQPTLVVSLMVSLSLSFILFVLIVASSLGLVDIMWQRANHQRKHRMSHKEMTDETKQAEGDPHTKQQRRQKGQEIAMNKMMADVPGADVIIVNPEHFAVALKWSRAPGSAPKCVAKGVDEVAARIRQIANENGVPIHRDAPTARALFAVIDIGEQIWSEHFKAVAVAIRFAESIAKKPPQSWSAK